LDRTLETISQTEVAEVPRKRPENRSSFLKPFQKEPFLVWFLPSQSLISRLSVSVSEYVFRQTVYLVQTDRIYCHSTLARPSTRFERAIDFQLFFRGRRQLSLGLLEIGHHTLEPTGIRFFQARIIGCPSISCRAAAVTRAFTEV
jgi:hypothetical protein